MKGLRVLVTLAFVVLPITGAGAGPGQPQRQSSKPRPGQTVHHVEEVSVTFDETLDPTSSRLRVHACGKRVDSGVMEFSATGETISVELDESPPGRYEATYRVRGLDDTPEERMRPTEGSFSFALHYQRCEEDGSKGGHRHDRGNGKRHENGRHAGGKGAEHGPDHDPGGTRHTGTHQSGSGSHAAHAAGDDAGEHAAGHGGSNKNDGSGKHDRHGKKRGRDGKHEGHGGKHKRRGSEGGRPPRPEPTRPNNALNLVLVLGIPTLVGALGGRALRARAVIPVR